MFLGSLAQVHCSKQFRDIQDVCEFTSRNHQSSAPSVHGSEFIITGNDSSYLPGRVMTGMF